MSSESVSAALENLEQIKNGSDPRAEVVEPDDDTPLGKVRALVNQMYEQYHWLDSHLPRENVHCLTSYWDRRRGQCYYNRKPETDKRNFGKRISQKKHFSRANGHHIIIINRAIVEAGEKGNWRDTVRHEMAHALQRQKYGAGCQSHGTEFKECAKKLDAKPKASHSARPEYLKD